MRKYITTLITCLFFLCLPCAIAQTTPDFTPEQHYLFDPSNTGIGHAIGVGAANVWAIPGARGAGVTVADIESGWHFTHEDLPAIQLIYGENDGDPNHGTAVFGIMAGKDNGLGITGICPDATMIASSIMSDSIMRVGTKDVPAAIVLTNGSQTESPVSAPAKFSLTQNYPNPFNPTTQISFSLPEPQLVTLEVYDITGRKIRTLLNQFREAGHHKLIWDSKNDVGEQVSSGVYIYQIKAGSFVANRKMMLLR